ncbi:MAG TPA: hypothetical protein VKX16_15255 [Chloroflexota bacterium]|nr:hypothetical protein [Chloroflexota bacterium]
MRLVRVGLALGGVVFAGYTGQVVVQAVGHSYDPFKQFSIKHNPSGAWSYVVDGSALTQPIKTCNGVKRVYCWTNGQSYPDAAAVEANKTGKTVSFQSIVLPPDYLDMDPENNPNVGFQWAAPKAGTFTVSGNFLGVDTGEVPHSVEILHNGASIYANTISSYGEEDSFDLQVSVEKGDTISFLNETNGPNALSTGLQAAIG